MKYTPLLPYRITACNNDSGEFCVVLIFVFLSKCWAAWWRRDYFACTCRLAASHKFHSKREFEYIDINNSIRQEKKMLFLRDTLTFLSIKPVLRTNLKLLEEVKQH